MYRSANSRRFLLLSLLIATAGIVMVCRSSRLVYLPILTFDLVQPLERSFRYDHVPPGIAEALRRTMSPQNSKDAISIHGALPSLNSTLRYMTTAKVDSTVSHAEPKAISTVSTIHDTTQYMLFSALKEASTSQAAVVDTDIGALSRIMFVHVGKAGGETAKYILRVGCTAFGNHEKRASCLQNLPPSKLSDSVTSYLHIEPKNPSATSRARAYLMVARDPVDRFISWYHYMHPAGCINTTSHKNIGCAVQREFIHDPDSLARRFLSCFPREIDVETMLNNQPDADWQPDKDVDTYSWKLLYDRYRTIGLESTVHCIPLLRQLTSGLVPDAWSWSGHMTANLQLYLNATVDQYPHKPVLVVRTKHMWDDLKAIDMALGGNGDFGRAEGLRITHKSASTVQRHAWTPAQRKPLCCLLLSEMQAYHRVLHSSDNLSPIQVETTWQETMASCNLQSLEQMVRECA
jgi:Sulfotransferase family